MSTFATSPEGELRAHLIASIGDGVFDAVEQQEIAIGNKPAPAQPDPPVEAVPPAAPAAPVQANPASAPAASPEPATTGGQPAEKLLLGKYKTEAEAEKGYYELLRMNKALLAKMDQLPPPAPVQQTASPSPITTAPAGDPLPSVAATKLKQIEELTGVPTADLQEALTDIARGIYQKEFETSYNRITEPQKKREAADIYMESNYPEAVKFGDEISQFVKTDPQTNALIGDLWKQGLYQTAMETSYLKWKLHMGAQQEHTLRVAEEVRKEEVAAARVDAGLMTTQAQSSRETVSAGPSPEELEKLAQLSRAGYNTPFLRATIGRSLPDSVFGPGA